MACKVDDGGGYRAARSRWLCGRVPEGIGDDLKHLGIGASGCKRHADARCGLDDAGGDLDEPQAQGGELGGCQSLGLGGLLADAPEQPVGGGVQDQPHLVGVGRAARGAIAGELRLVAFDKVFGLTTRTVERIIDMLGRAFGQRSDDIADVHP